MRSLLKRFDLPLVCVLIAATVFLAFIFGRLYQANFDPSSFVVAGDRFCDPAGVPARLNVLPNSNGYDGQFYYRLALNPFTAQPTEFGITLDNAPLRHQRILYPLLAWVFSFGNPEKLPWVLILINFLGLCLVAWLSGKYAQSLGQQALWGIVVPFYPGFLLSLSRDTVEIVEAALVIASLLLLRRARPWGATICLCFAILTKETAVIVAVAAAGVFIVASLKASKASLRWYYAACPLATFALWQLIQFTLWREVPILMSGSANLTIPFVEPARALFDASLVQRPIQLRKSAELIFLFAFGAAVLFRIRSARTPQHEIISWLLITALAVCLGASVWIEDWTFMRVLSLFYVLGALMLLADGLKIRLPIFATALLLWGVVFFKLMRSYTMA